MHDIHLGIIPTQIAKEEKYTTMYRRTTAVYYTPTNIHITQPMDNQRLL